MTDADCATSTAGPICSANVCVPCTPSVDICPPFEYCTTNNECVPGCQVDNDCLGSPDGPLCVGNACVPCTPQNDLCPQGEFCDMNNDCVTGCVDDSDCVGVPDGPICEGMICVPCTPQNDICLPGNYCDSTNTCVPGCVDNDDCVGVPDGPICDAMSCVPCTPTQDVCPQGEYCSSSNLCEPGCTDDNDCAISPVGPLCDLGANTCVECTPQNDICPQGEYCDSTNTCVTGCVDADDCVGVPAGPLCEGMECVPCTPQNDLCPQGEYCTASNDCEPGCTDDSDCGGSTVCNTATNTCVGCVDDTECAAGTVCDTGSGTCVPGCNATQPCAGTDECCNDQCIDTDSDVANCGGCGNTCAIPNADAACVDGSCELSACQGNFNDCNDDPADGCETTQACLCVPGTTVSCYTGPAGTNNVGECSPGTQTCNANGIGYGPCTGQTLPSPEVCGDGLDNDCNGLTDASGDPDGDGYELCDGGDCCEDIFCAANPELINPGAFDVDGDGIDNDCDGTIDENETNCEPALAGTGGTQADVTNYLRAIELCQETTSTATGAQKTWGIITDSGGDIFAPRLRKADGANGQNGEQSAVRPDFGSATTMQPRAGGWMSVLSTGYAAATAHTNPSFVTWQEIPSSLTETDGGVPNDWFNAVGGTAPAAPGCNQTSDINEVYHPIALEFLVRAPTNANSFSVDMYLLSSEYPEWVCDSFNDFVVVLIDQPNGTPVNTAIPNPGDENLAFFTNPGDNQDYPVGVNLAGASLFRHCNEQTMRDCAVFFSGGVTETNPVTCLDNQLTGSGYDDPGITEYCSASNIFGCTQVSTCYSGDVGGGTGLLSLAGNVSPGEIFRIRIAIWDSGDNLFDSTVLFDNWAWDTQAATPGVTPG